MTDFFPPTAPPIHLPPASYLIIGLDLFGRQGRAEAEGQLPGLHVRVVLVTPLLPLLAARAPQLRRQAQLSAGPEQTREPQHLAAGGGR